MTMSNTQNSLGIVCNTNAGSESAAEEVRLFQQTDSNICECEAENRECRRWARGQRSCPSRSCVWPQLLRPRGARGLPYGNRCNSENVQVSKEPGVLCVLLSPEQSAGVDCLFQSPGVCKIRLSAAIKRAQQLNQLCNVSMRVSFQIDEAQIAWVGCATVLTAARTACN